MGVALRRQRDGSLRPYWYGEYVDTNGMRKAINLGVWEGTPPAALLGEGDSTTGDKDFEASRERAEVAFAAYMEEVGRKGRAEHLTERLIESKTGRRVEYVRIDALGRCWRDLGREVPASEAHLRNCDAHFNRFVEWMARRNPVAKYLYEVTPEDAAEFTRQLRKDLAPATAQYGVRLLNKAMGRFLPVGAANPFAVFVGRKRAGESGVIHRKPFTSDELRAVLAAAREDELLYPLVVTAMCTGMRRGDVCRLKWSDVDLRAGMLTVKTSKTESRVEIPIFAPLREVLTTGKAGGRGFVFPEAAELIEKNADQLSWRFKKIVARALGAGVPEPEMPEVAAGDVLEAGLKAIRENCGGLRRRERILDTFQRYCGGESLKTIQKATGGAKGTISADLHAVEEWIGKRFVRRTPGRQSGGSIRKVVDAVTRVSRKQGQNAASVRDWHALRTTWVTLALTAGVPVEIVQRVTGHRTVSVVMEHYFRPGREEFKRVLADAMPPLLTGGEAGKVTQGKADLQELAAKVCDGTATKAERARFKKLAAKV